ncbi:MAG: DUF3499 domain-containing protein [Actinomycetaceae bacterium]|nr:DUF3499 domain-containing protein [Actinomycetaceae bacterium]
MSPIRRCSRTNCQQGAVATMTYGYAEATAVIGPLSPTPLAGAYDLCAEHALTVTVPVGWTMVRLVTEFEPVPPSDNDLTALADAIRAASQKEVPPPRPAQRDVRRPTGDVDRRPRPRKRPQLSVIAGGADDVNEPAVDKMPSATKPVVGKTPPAGNNPSGHSRSGHNRSDRAAQRTLKPVDED